jgi:hypothetical protein
MANHNLLIVILLMTGFSIQCAYADADLNSTIQEMQDCLKNQNCNASKSPEAEVAKQRALAAVSGNPNSAQALYEISADIMPMLIQQSSGDPAKMQLLMQKAKDDPDGFLSSLPLDLQAKIKKVAAAIESNQSVNQNP